MPQICACVTSPGQTYALPDDVTLILPGQGATRKVSPFPLIAHLAGRNAKQAIFVGFFHILGDVLGDDKPIFPCPRPASRQSRWRQSGDRPLIIAWGGGTRPRRTASAPLSKPGPQNGRTIHGKWSSCACRTFRATRYSGPISAGDILEKRRRLMQDWADYCTSEAESAAGTNVVSLRAAT